MRAEQNLKKVIERVGDLPAMPESVAQVLHITDDPNSDMGSIGEVIERDPSLTAKILRVSNSPFYGMRQYVGTLKLALVILGVREIRNIVLGVSLYDSLRSDHVESLLAQDYWNHSFQTASFCKILGARLKLKLEGESFVAGLLHDMGKMILGRQLGLEYAKVLNECAGYGDDLVKLELAHFNFTHADAAAVLARQWNLPSTLCDAIWVHHPTHLHCLEDAKDMQLAALVRIANLAVRDPWAQGDPDACAAPGDAEAWACLEGVPEPLPANRRYEALSAIADEVRAAPSFVL